MNEHVEKGHSFLEEEIPEAARAAFEKALEEDPDNLEAQFGLARALAIAGDRPEAIIAYRAALSRERRGAELAALAELLLGVGEGEDDEAKTLVDDAIEQDPDHHAGHLLKAELASRAEDYATADDHLRKAVHRGAEVPKAHAFALYHRWVHQLISDNERAQAATVAIRADNIFGPHRPLSLLAAGAAEATGDNKEAIARYKGALIDLEPGELRLEILEKIAKIAG